jgi:hypothetical protein
MDSPKVDGAIVAQCGAIMARFPASVARLWCDYGAIIHVGGAIRHGRGAIRDKSGAIAVSVTHCGASSRIRLRGHSRLLRRVTYPALV